MSRSRANGDFKTPCDVNFSDYIIDSNPSGVYVVRIVHLEGMLDSEYYFYISLKEMLEKEFGTYFKPSIII